MQISQVMLWLVRAMTMTIPIVMVFLSLTLNYPVNRWANTIVARFFLGYGLIGLPSCPSAYGGFLLIVGFVVNALTVWHVWRLRKQERVEVTR